MPSTPKQWAALGLHSPRPVVPSAFISCYGFSSRPLSASFCCPARLGMGFPEGRVRGTGEEAPHQPLVDPGCLVLRKMLKCTLGAEDTRARVAIDSRNAGPALPFSILL